MNRYIVGTVMLLGHPVWICWDNRNGHLDAVEPTIKGHIAGPEVGPYERAIIEHELQAGMGLLNGADRVPVWLRHRHERFTTHASPSFTET